MSKKDRLHVSGGIPLRRLTHPLDNPVESVFTALFQSLGYRFDTLLIGSVLKQTTKKML